MKKILIILFAFSLLLLPACDKATAEVDALKAEIESLKKQVEEANLKEAAKDALETAKKEIEALKEQLVKTKEELEQALTKKETEKPTDHSKASDSTVKKDDPVSAEEAMGILEPLGLPLEKKDNPEFSGVIGNKQGQDGDVYCLFYALAKNEGKALELFQEKVNEESHFTKEKDHDDDKIYTIRREGEALLAVLDDEAFFFGKAKDLDKLKEIAQSLGVDLD